jgi:hypothetical protein
MANTYSTEAQLLQNTPREMPNGSYAGGRLRRFRNTITLAGQAAADTITLQPVPAGHVFAFGIIIATATLGASATIAIGVSGTPAKFRTAAVFTAVETPTLFGLSTAIDDDFLTATETPIITIAVAALPGSGKAVVDMYYSGQ